MSDPLTPEEALRLLDDVIAYRDCKACVGPWTSDDLRRLRTQVESWARDAGWLERIKAAMLQDATREWEREVEAEAVRLIESGTPPFDAVHRARNIVSDRRRQRSRVSPSTGERPE